MKLIQPYVKILEDNDHYEYLIKKISDAGWTSTRYFPDYSSSNLDRFVKPGERTKFVEKLIKNKHDSCLEHGTISVLIVADRGFMAELTRHRVGIAYTIESTRYCNYTGSRFDEIEFIDPKCYYDDLDKVEYAVIHKTLADIEETYRFLVESRKIKPEIARCVLPNALVVHIYVTANIREWRYILSLRSTKTNHPFMRKIMKMLLNEFKKKYPIFFKDI